MKLYDNITIDIFLYKNQYKTFKRSRREYQFYPIFHNKKYMLTKLWNKDLNKAKYLYDLLVNDRKYDKVKIHNGCVYTTRRL